MHSLNFDEGYKEFAINDDPNRVIRFNPSDVAIVERIKNASAALEKLVEEYGTEEETKEEAFARLDKAIKEQIDYMFNQPVAEIVFGGQSPMSPVGGKMLFERFLESVTPVIEESVRNEQKASAERVGKYVSAARNV
ncbi:MAG: hypothetical protein ACI4FZ_08745 [Lachnospiraceae bacterium]